MTAAKSVTANFNLVPKLLTVSKTGTGTGTVTSSPTGINCGSTCSANFAANSTVTLTASSATNSTFAGWSGACTSAATTCTVSMTAAKSVTANFNLVPRQLTVSKTGTGTGTVKSSPAGINCGVSCVANFANNSTVTLTAAPTLGSIFTGWSGACTNVTGVCTVSMNATKSVVANFTNANCKTSVGVGSSLNSSWNIGCRSTHRTANAKYYTFTLNTARSVTIDLSASGSDTYLYLLSGNNINGSVITEVDDYGASVNSRIVRSLSAGTYTIEATTFNDVPTGNFNLRIQ